MNNMEGRTAMDVHFMPIKHHLYEKNGGLDCANNMQHKISTYQISVAG